MPPRTYCGRPMIGWGEIFSVSCAITWALAVVMWRRFSADLPAFELNLVKNFIGFGLLIPTVLIMEGLNVPAYSTRDWVIVLLSGYVGLALADTWYLRALQLMGASRTGITASLYSPFVILLSVLFLGERLGWFQMVGFVMVLAGILLVNWRQGQQEIDSRALRQGLAWGVAAVFLMAVGIVMVKEVLETEPFFWTVLIRLSAGIAGMLIFAWLRGSWRSTLRHIRQPQPWRWIIIASVLGTYVSMLLWMAGYKLTSASVASVLNESASAFIVLFAFLLLGEPLSRRKLAGLGLTLAGVVVMVLA